MQTNKDQLVTDEDVEAQLAGEAVRGPRMWTCGGVKRPLAPIRRGLRNLWIAVTTNDDPLEFQYFALLEILAEAHFEDPKDEFAKRRALMAATEDVLTFRTQLDFRLDHLEANEVGPTINLARELLALVDKAKTVLVADPTKKKDDAPALEVTSPTETPCTSSGS